MIFGIGTDIVDVDRIKRSLEKGDGFREFIFSAKEIAYCEKNKINYQSYAARFAAKEAFLKALGTGWRGQTAFSEIEVNNNELGKPEIVLSGKTLKEFLEISGGKIHLSLSHTAQQAIAFVTIEI